MKNIKNVKFEECFLRNRDMFISVEDLKEIHGRDYSEYEKEYYGDFYCPDCLYAKLSFHPNAVTPHFRSQGEHEKDCWLNYPPASKKEVEEYCADCKNREVINRKLNSCLDLLSKEAVLQKSIKIKIENTDVTKRLNDFTIGEGATRKSLHRKKLTAPLRDSDYGIPKLFYGSVLLKWDLRLENVKFLRIRYVKNRESICSIAISKNIYTHLQDNAKFNEEKTCDIAFLSTMEKDKTKKYNNGRIKYSTELIIRLNDD